MPFIPRLKPQIHQELLARVIARSELTDVEASSVINAVLSTLAEEFEAVEFNMRAVRDSFDVRKVSAQYLDERCAELPPTGVSRLQAAAASGAVMQFTRESTSGSLTIPAGSTFGRVDSDVLYVLQNEVTMADGQGTYPSGDTAYATVTASVAGEIGNAPAGVITSILDAPGGLSVVNNPNPILGGQNVEPDASLRERAQMYLSSLARSQRASLEGVALSFQASDGTRVRHAKAVDDPLNPGTVELIIDDGSGLENAANTFVTSSVQTMGVNLSPIIFHEGPASQPITKLMVDFGEGFVEIESSDFSDANNPGWVSHPEKGLVLLQNVFSQNIPGVGKVIKSGTKIKIPDKTFLRYTGVVQELQDFIEGKASDAENFPGMRAAGIRVVVKPPLVENIDMQFGLVFEPGVDFTEQVEIVKAAIVSYMRDLGPGDTLFLGLLTRFLIDGVPELLSIHFQDPSTDRSASTHRHVLRANAANMVLTQQTEV